MVIPSLLRFDGVEGQEFEPYLLQLLSQYVTVFFDQFKDECLMDPNMGLVIWWVSELMSKKEDQFHIPQTPPPKKGECMAISAAYIKWHSFQLKMKSKEDM